ncbi:MAG: hypothetical protein WC294_09925 [Methanoregula sp.]|jgi:hypothetical protein
MKIKKPDAYTSAAILLMASAAILIAVALVASLGEFVTAAFVVSGTACALIGLFMLTFTRGETVDSRNVGILIAQWCKNISSIESDLGITGNAYFLPPRVTGEPRVMQFNPTLTFSGSNIPAKDTYSKTGAGGLIVTPCCEPWIQDLRKRNALVIPEKEEELIILMNETVGEVFDFASRVSGSWHDNTITLTFHRYRFIDGCKAIAQESEELCTMNPCPVCSLCGSLIAEGTDKIVTLDRCSVNPSNRDVTAIFTMSPFRKVTASAEHSSSGTASGRLH